MAIVVNAAFPSETTSVDGNITIPASIADQHHNTMDTNGIVTTTGTAVTADSLKAVIEAP